MLSAVQQLFKTQIIEGCLYKSIKFCLKPCCSKSQVYDVVLLSIKKNILPKYTKLKSYLTEKEEKKPQQLEAF